MLNVLFICTGNICRTPMAEYQLKHLIEREGLQDKISAVSAGTDALVGYPAADFTAAVSRAHGIDTSSHRARSVNPQIINEADIVLCMEHHHLMDLQQIFPHFKDKIFLLKLFARENADMDGSIKDPYGGPKENYESTFHEIREEVERIWPKIKQLAKKT